MIAQVTCARPRNCAPHSITVWPSSASSTSCWRRPQVALPHLGEGASIIATGSTAALMDVAKKDEPGGDPGGMAYLYSKRLIAEYGGYLKCYDYRI
jgi:hypothetical protein